MFVDHLNEVGRGVADALAFDDSFSYFLLESVLKMNVAFQVFVMDGNDTN